MKYLHALMALLLLTPVVTQAAECTARSPERFTDFLPTFSESKGFALQRTVLPLPLLNWAQGVDTEGRPLTGPQKVYLSASDYWRWPSLNLYMQQNELLAEVRSQTKSEAVVELYKEGREGLVTFHFKTKKGCWYLWQYEVRG